MGATHGNWGSDRDLPGRIVEALRSYTVVMTLATEKGSE
jgi:hypothetical protein